MGLIAADKYKGFISLPTAYKKIKNWYAENPNTNPRWHAQYREASNKLAQALPDNPSELEILAILDEVLRGNLEWAFHESDGHYKMAAYAEGALKSGNYPEYFSKENRQLIEKSPIFHLLMPRAS